MYKRQSHTPAEALHTVPAAMKTSAGHGAEAPVHVSCGSQVPDEAR